MRRVPHGQKSLAPLLALHADCCIATMVYLVMPAHDCLGENKQGERHAKAKRSPRSFMLKALVFESTFGSAKGL